MAKEKKPLVLLQNAWSRAYAGREWPHRTWLPALYHSRSGQRLRFMLGEDWSNWDFDNTTPIVGETPSSVVPPDLDHLARITEDRPYIIGCGIQAHTYLFEHWPGRMLIMPHPANRVLTNALLTEARKFLNNPIGRYRLHQGRGSVRWESLLGHGQETKV